MPAEKKRKWGAIETSLADRPSQLHPLNPYCNRDPNFVELGKLYPDGLGKYIHPDTGRIDFTDLKAVIELNKALLRSDFDLDVIFLENRLCPPVPNRLNYICWLWELLQLRDINTTQKEVQSSSRCSDAPSECTTACKNETGRKVDQHVLDIGVGASCIYPLLGAKMHSWRFPGVDIDNEAVKCAKKNAELNSSLSSLISIKHVASAGSELQRIVCSAIDESSVLGDILPVLDGSTEAASYPFEKLVKMLSENHSRPLGPLANALNVLENDEALSVTAVMTNPPFYSDSDEIFRNSKTVCSGSELEMITIGGEVAFVGAIIADSLFVRDKISWYTATLGKKSSLRPLLKLLAFLNITNFRTVRFMGGVTTRWGLAWSFTSKGAHNLPYIGRCSDPKVTDIGSLDKLLAVTSGFDISYLDVWAGMLVAEKNSLEVNSFPVFTVLISRILNSFQDLESNSTEWKYVCVSQANFPCSAELKVSGRKGPAAFLQDTPPDLEITLHLKLVNIDQKIVRISYECYCLAKTLTPFAREIYDMLKVGVYRNNRRWRRLLMKN
jgi:23S rRNA A1618 N6-methylase RlmF